MEIPKNVKDGMELFERGQWVMPIDPETTHVELDIQQTLAEIFPYVHERQLILTIERSNDTIKFEWIPAYPAVRYITSHVTIELEKKV